MLSSFEYWHLTLGGTMLSHLVAAARPNFMEIAPLYHALKKETWSVPVIVHTGQHYDLSVSAAFFEDLESKVSSMLSGTNSRDRFAGL
jgi:UDP-N-acetylglucosamine 2-epimerase (non-hydrolysing)